MKIKQLIKRKPFLYHLVTRGISLFGKNRIAGKRTNCIRFIGAILKRSTICIDGNNNSIYIDEGSKICNVQIEIYGSYNQIIIGKNVCLNGVKIHIEDDKNVITIGDDTQIFENTELAVIEGTKISIGNNCLISSEVDIRTGDSHSVIDELGERKNWSKSIEINNHIWIGTRAILLKGVILEENSVIAAGSVVTKSYSGKGIILAGNPAKVVKKGISWDERRYDNP